jgi:hypothetical protein
MSALGKRKSARWALGSRQLVADYDGETLPISDDFHWVTVQDISAGGASFISDRKPSKKHVVVALGKGPVCIARVIRSHCRARLPEPVYEVGCEFVQKLA